MDIVIGYPPNYKEIAAKFAVTPRTIYAWGTVIYNPSGMRIPGDLVAHEKVHQQQQELFGSVTGWWDKYLSDSDFTLSQEAEAYRRQYQYLCSQNPNRNLQFEILKALGLLLSGPMYGNVCSLEEAMNLIRQQ